MHLTINFEYFFNFLRRYFLHLCSISVLLSKINFLCTIRLLLSKLHKICPKFYTSDLFELCKNVQIMSNVTLKTYLLFCGKKGMTIPNEF